MINGIKEGKNFNFNNIVHAVLSRNKEETKVRMLNRFEQKFKFLIIRKILLKIFFEQFKYMKQTNTVLQETRHQTMCKYLLSKDQNNFNPQSYKNGEIDNIPPPMNADHRKSL